MAAMVGMAAAMVVGTVAACRTAMGLVFDDIFIISISFTN